ncbi:RNA polymerase sigma factor [Kineococcus gynurae]|uniref:RNA polymerase sigma factor n=1 Tax=Kineococcus gynurae TaxID=452979 RepID=A0ABV5LRE5_9ACTN
MTATDEILARRAGLGDGDAFAVLVDRHGPALLRYARRLLDVPAEAEDCVQDVLVDAWKGLPGFRYEASVKTWLFTLLRHRVSQRARRVPASGSLPHVDVDEVAERLADLRADPARSNEGRALVAALDEALRLLPSRQRAAWILTEVEQLSYAETARVLATSPTAVRGLLERGRRTLATALADWR